MFPTQVWLDKYLIADDSAAHFIALAINIGLGKHVGAEFCCVFHVILRQTESEARADLDLDRVAVRLPVVQRVEYPGVSVQPEHIPLSD